MKFDAQSSSNKMNLEWTSSSVGNIKKPRSNFNGFVQGKFIYIYGGLSGVDTNENTIEKYNCEKLFSEVLVFKNEPKGFYWPAFSVTVPNDDKSFFIIGGTHKSESMSQVYMVNVDDRKIELHSNLNKKRSSFVGFKTQNPSTLIVFGGDGVEEGLTSEY